MVSGSLSLPWMGCFSPFPHGTCSLSVSRECLALPGGPGRFRRDFSCPALLRMPLGAGRLRVRGCHPLRPGFPAGSARLHRCRGAVLLPRGGLATAAVWALPRSLATTGGITCCFLFLRVLRCFSSPRWLRRVSGGAGLKPCGLSHSDAPGSRAVCASPGIFAAYRVLHRLREPRHPPCALTYFFPLRDLPETYPGSPHAYSQPPPRKCGRRCVSKSSFTTVLCATKSKNVATQRRGSPRPRAMWRISGSNR